ncbi:MAG TPA: high frequency lysogenization protein HflD [Mariprofundaceae bacterium]|nr:high frequency lysogenization protein HflD [Mariprofundaceae bacterium]
MSDTPHIHANQATAQANRALALAAITQVASMVESIARNGICDAEDYQTMISSLFAENNDHVGSMYGGIYPLRTGLHLSSKLLTGSNIEQAKPLLTYASGLMALERRLSKNSVMLATIGEGMQRIKKQSDYFGSETHASVIGGIADLYGNTISTLKPSIIVRGKPEHLKQSSNTNKVRALLFSGIRAAHLWHKHGGGHFRLLIGRKKLHQQTQKLLEELSNL